MTAGPARHVSGTRRRRHHPVGSPNDDSLPSGSTSRRSRIPQSRTAGGAAPPDRQHRAPEADHRGRVGLRHLALLGGVRPGRHAGARLGPRRRSHDHPHAGHGARSADQPGHAATAIGARGGGRRTDRTGSDTRVDPIRRCPSIDEGGPGTRTRDIRVGSSAMRHAGHRAGRNPLQVAAPGRPSHLQQRGVDPTRRGDAHRVHRRLEHAVRLNAPSAPTLRRESRIGALRGQG